MLTWRHHGGRLNPDDLERYFPSDLEADLPDPSDAIEATVLGNVPGTGHHPISDVVEQSLAAAQHRIDIVNPYISNKAILAGCSLRHSEAWPSG